MHESLAETLQLGKSGLTCRHFGEIGIHAGIPAAEALYTVTGIEILDIIALAGGADKGSGAATETRLRKLLPLGCAEKLFGLAIAESVCRERGKRELLHALTYQLFLL